MWWDIVDTLRERRALAAGVVAALAVVMVAVVLLAGRDASPPPATVVGPTRQTSATSKCDEAYAELKKVLAEPVNTDPTAAKAHATAVARADVAAKQACATG
jgi:hypothetical protein